MSEINLKSLNKEQIEAVTHSDGPLLIVAGAGTGKTTVVTQRVAWLISKKKLKPEEILVLTFTDKAAGEMEERVDKLLPLGYTDLWVSTFHSFAERILKTHALDIGLPLDFKLINQTDAWMLVRKNLDKFKLDYYRPVGNPTKFIHALLQHFSRCKDEEIYPENYLQYAEELKLNLDNMENSRGKAAPADKGALTGDFLQDDFGEITRLNEVANAYHVYQQILLENNSLDFGDLINYTLKLFKQRPNLLKKYQEQFKYILVDEFQDTNWAQYELIKLIAGEPANITVVGDDDQSIYKFRGASVSNILNFKKDYPQALEIFLTKNYRSPQKVLDLAYNFIQLNNPDRLEIKLSDANKKLSKKLTSQKKDSGLVEYNFFSSLAEEVGKVADKIIELKEKDKEADWNDFAILVRANDAANDFMAELESRQIPQQFMAARGLYQKPVVRDIVNYLRLLDDYRESPALYRVLSMPIFKISQYQISNLMYWAGRKNWSLFEILRNISVIKNVEPDTASQISKLITWIDKHSSLAKEKSVWEVILAFLTDSGYLEFIKELAPLQTRQIFNELNQFGKKVSHFCKNSNNNKVSDWLDEFEMELDSGDTGSLEWDVESGPESVKIMTIHGAKGLEFKYVFVPNLVDKRFPTIKRSDPIELPDDLVKEILPEGDAHLQEERRLFYVALTRAGKGLFLSGGKDYGGMRSKKPSRFIVELGLVENNIEGKENLSDTKPDQQNFNTAKSRVKNNKKSPELEKIPERFSFTQLKAFSSCPLQYKYAHILRIPVRGKPTFSFGKTIHSTLQKFFELVRSQAQAEQPDLFSSTGKKSKNPQASEKDLLDIYEKCWIDDWFDDKKQEKDYKEKGKNALKVFYKDWSVSKKIPEYLEKGFNLKIDDYTIRGVIDRIDRASDGGLEIIDYKTGRSKDLTKIDASNKMQLLIYQIAVSQIFSSEPKSLTFYYIEDNQRATFLGSEKEIEKVKLEINNIVTKIREGNFQATPSLHVCKYCDFKEICDSSQA